MSACGAREANTSVVSRAFRCARCGTWSAIERAADAAVLRPAGHAGLVEGAVDDQLAAAVEQVEQARRAVRALEARSPSPSPATASAGARRPARRGRGSAPSPSRAVARRAASHSCGETIGVCSSRAPSSDPGVRSARRDTERGRERNGGVIEGVSDDALAVPARATRTPSRSWSIRTGGSCSCTATGSSARCTTPRTRSRRRCSRPGEGWTASRDVRRCAPGCTGSRPTAA